jgi:AraC-like DNA-binding protein/mannose-6-phosphate isomerase-like protein (cupin superfamily)
MIFDDPPPAIAYAANFVMVALHPGGFFLPGWTGPGMKPDQSQPGLVINLNPLGRLLDGRRFLYRWNDEARLIEVGAWSGDRSLPLKHHFHNEIQMTFVLSGRYGFFIGDRMLSAEAGECIIIPALRPHAPVPHEQRGTTTFNAYVPVGQFPAKVVSAAVFPIQDAWLAQGSVRLDDLASLLGQARPMNQVSRETVDQLPLELLESSARIHEIASAIGLSRQGFIRKFSRQIGMSPHAYRLTRRINDARALLRQGEAIAVVAAETGFADQSELGRHFRRAFGTTPGLYRKQYL